MRPFQASCGSTKGAPAGSPKFISWNSNFSGLYSAVEVELWALIYVIVMNEENALNWVIFRLFWCYNKNNWAFYSNCILAFLEQLSFFCSILTIFVIFCIFLEKLKIYLKFDYFWNLDLLKITINLSMYSSLYDFARIPIKPWLLKNY